MPDDPQIGEPVGLLRLEFSDEQRVAPFTRFLMSLGRLYIADIEFDLKISPVFQGETPPLKAPPLTIRTLHIASPGWLEVVGALNPLTFIHNMTKLVLTHTSASEERKIKNEKLWVEVVREKTALLKDLGFSPEQIRAAAMIELLGKRVSRYSAAIERVRVLDVSYKRLPEGHHKKSDPGAS